MRKTLLFLLGAFALCLIANVVSAQVTVTKRDTLIYDPNNNDAANPGDSLRYKTKIKNTSGANVTGATLDMNASSNLGAPTTIRTTPVALNDVYAATGNIGISVPAGSGLKLNDFDDNLALATIQTQVNQPTAMGGTVNVNADGSFTYSPAAGFTGADNFTYVLEDGNEVAGCPPINHAVVTLNVAAAAPAMIWFIDNGAGGSGGTGTLSNPFRTIADFNASAGPQVGHIVFLENTGTNYTGPINLKNNQTLWGSGHTGGSNLADLITEAPNSFTLPPINTTRPIIGSASDGILLAMGNSIRGLNIGNCTDFGIDDNGGTVGTLTISELNITNASGGGFRAANGGTLAVTLGSLSSTGGPNGIHLGSCGGSFIGGTGAITSPNGIAVNIAGGTVGFTYSGNITQANNFAMVSVSGGHTTGTVTFQTGTLSATNGTGLQFNNADSPTSYNFLGTTTLNGGAAAVNIVNGSAGAFTFGANTTITSPTDTAFAVIGGTASVTYSGNITQANNFPMVSVSGGHTTGTITFQTGTLSATNGSGLQFDNADSPTSYNFNGSVSLNGGNAGIDIVNGSIGSFTFLNCTIINPSGDAVEVTGSNAILSYTGVIRDNSGYAIDIDNHDANTMTFAGDSLVSNGTGTGIRVANSNGGTINFNHSLKRLTTGANHGVDLTTSNGSGTMNFGNGGLIITTTSGTGFNATGGGTVNVTTGTNPNTINSGTGTALNVANTTIGSSNLNFRSISSSGGSEAGIVLNNTGGSGGLMVTGSGSAGSGGTIANKTGSNIWSFGGGIPTLNGTTVGVGVYLNSTQGTSLGWMQLNDFTNAGISVFASSNFTVQNTVVSGVNGEDVAQSESAVFCYNLTGTAAVTSCTIGGGNNENLYVLNTTGSLNRLTITGSTFGFNSTAEGNNNILIEARNSGTTLNFTLQSSTIKGARADWINASNNSLSVMDAIVGGTSLALGNTFDNLAANAHPGAAAGGNRIVFGSVGSLTFDVNNNNTKGAKGEAIRIRSTATGVTTGTATGHVRNNIIGVAGTANSGSSESFGIFAFGDGGSDMTISITNNQVYQYNNHGISCTFGDEINNGSSFQVTVTGNTVSNPGNLNSDFNGFHLNNGTVLATDDFTTCLHLSGNTLTSSGNGAIYPNNAEFRLRQRQNTTVILPGYGGLNNEDCNVVAFVAAQNTVSNCGACGANCINGTPNPPTKFGAAATQNATTTLRGFESGSPCPTN